MFLSLPIVSTAQPVFYGINCGSDRMYTTPGGNIFYPDLPYSPHTRFGLVDNSSRVLAPNRKIDHSEGLDTLFFVWREGDFGYRFDVPAGQYAVTLYFAEKVYHWRDFREFPVIAEGETLAVIDIHESTDNRDCALFHRELVNCDDGALEVELEPGISEAQLSAISIRSLEQDTVPPLQPTGLTILAGYEMNILNWDYDTSPDLESYKLYRRSPGQPWEQVLPENYLTSGYIDRGLSPGVEHEYALRAVDLWGNVSAATSLISAAPYSNTHTSFPRYNFDISDEDLYNLNIDIWSEEYQDADLTLESVYYPGGGVRYRGDTSRRLNKKSYKLKLAPEELHNQRDRFNLQAEGKDASMVNNLFSCQSYDLVGLLNPLSQYVYLERNGEYIGLYVDCEQVDEHFLVRNRLSPAGNLYKVIYEENYGLSPLDSLEQYQLLYPRVNNPEASWDDLIEFIQWINYSTPENFHLQAGSKFAVDDYIDMYSVIIITADPDWPTHNFYMYIDPTDHKWYFISRDHNETFYFTFAPLDWGTPQNPIWGIRWNNLMTKVLADTLFRYAYCKKMERLLNTDFSVQSMNYRLDSLHQAITFDAVRDVKKLGLEDSTLFCTRIDSLHNFTNQRIPFLLSEIPSYITNPDLTPYFRLNEIQTNNHTTFPDNAGDYDAWLEIYNFAPVELDLEGFTLRWDSQSWTLPSEAVIDDYGYLILWLDGEPGEGALHAPFALPNSGGALYLESRNGSLSDSVTFPALNADRVWARSIDGRGDWNGNIPPSPGSTNNPPPDPSGLRINEFLALNNSVNRDSAGDYDDWVEIYNPGGDSIPLGGLYLTDDFTIPTRWVFPDTTLAPGGFLLIWCDDELFEGILHTNFRLDGDGESIGLFDRDASTPIDTLNFGPQEEDISFGRYPDGGDNWCLMDPTPEAPNVNTAINCGYSEGKVPSNFALYGVYPNPFNSRAALRFDIPRLAEVKLAVYDIQGREVARLAAGWYPAGTHQAVWDASKVASGVYFARLDAGDFMQTCKLLLLK